MQLQNQLYSIIIDESILFVVKTDASETTIAANFSQELRYSIDWEKGITRLYHFI